MKYLTEAQEKKLTVAAEVLKKYFSGVAEQQETTHDPSLINEYREALAVWKADGVYKRNDVRKDPENERPYWALHDHRSADYGNKMPHEDTALWRECHGTSAETAGDFVEDAANLYYKGHWCKTEGGTWEYISDTPSAYAPEVVPAYWRKAE